MKLQARAAALILPAFVAGVACLTATTTLAQERPIGYVKTVTPDASIITGGKPAAAVVGSAVRIGDTLHTGRGGSMGVTFRDDTIMSIGADTDIVVDEYLYAPGQDALKLVASLARGTLNYVSGVIARLRPEAVLIKTPTGTIGVRGTHFAASVVTP